MKKLIVLILLSGCSASITVGSPGSYSKAEIAQAFKERDAYLGGLNQRLEKLENTPPEKK